jgi:hypothetical protein
MRSNQGSVQSLIFAYLPVRRPLCQGEIKPDFQLLTVDDGYPYLGWWLDVTAGHDLKKRGTFWRNKPKPLKHQAAGNERNAGIFFLRTPRVGGLKF